MRAQGFDTVEQMEQFYARMQGYFRRVEERKSEAAASTPPLEELNSLNSQFGLTPPGLTPPGPGGLTPNSALCLTKILLALAKTVVTLTKFLIFLGRTKTMVVITKFLILLGLKKTCVRMPPRSADLTLVVRRLTGGRPMTAVSFVRIRSRSPMVPRRNLILRYHPPMGLVLHLRFPLRKTQRRGNLTGLASPTVGQSLDLSLLKKLPTSS